MADPIELFVRWLLLGLGLVYFFTESAIFSLPRVALTRGSDFRTGLLYCPACVGFWVGLCISGLWVHQGWPHQNGWYILESGIAMMAVGAAWSNWCGGNSAYAAEVANDKKEEVEDGR